MSILQRSPRKTGRNDDTPEWADAALRLLLADQRSEETRRAYRRDIDAFFTWAGEPRTPETIAWLCTRDHSELAALLNGYKASLLERHLAPATVNRRLAALRSLLRFARRLGAPCPDPAGLVASERQAAYRDTAGPPFAALARLLEAVDTSDTIGKRDRAILRLFAENALRRGEICRCDVRDFEPEARRLLIRGKGQAGQRVPITLSTATVAAICDYLEARPSPDDPSAEGTPLFLSHSRGATASEGRLTGNGIWRIVDGYTRAVLGRHFGCHALRHASITAALDATEGNLRAVQRLSRHADIRTVARYDDNRRDMQGELTDTLSELLRRPPERNSGESGE
ncbi:MAG: tyrosine-type recombinase/integrase [Capsulimonadales bacterium]|nr:tyrosine-type recombinase/integrase [Capsulimonadales bacterium]